MLDYIIANEDRHLNNFGALRNAETLEWLGMAPIYDSGSSLGYDKSVPLMMNAREVICKPFKKHHEELLKLVSDFGWIDFANHPLCRSKDLRTAVIRARTVRLCLLDGNGAGSFAVQSAKGPLFFRYAFSALSRCSSAIRSSSTFGLSCFGGLPVLSALAALRTALPVLLRDRSLPVPVLSNGCLSQIVLTFHFN